MLWKGNRVDANCKIAKHMATNIFVVLWLRSMRCRCVPERRPPIIRGGSPLGFWYCGGKERIFSCLRLSISLLLLLLVSIISCIPLISCEMCGEIYKGWISIVFQIYLFWIGFERIFNCILYLFYRDKIAIKHLTFLRYETDGLRRRAKME